MTMWWLAADVQRRVQLSEEPLGCRDEFIGGEGRDADAVGVVDLDRVSQGAAQQFPVPRVERDRKRADDIDDRGAIDEPLEGEIVHLCSLVVWSWITHRKPAVTPPSIE